MQSIYKKEIIEYIKLKLESDLPKSAIAREVQRVFNPPTTFNGVRSKVSEIATEMRYERSQRPIKRLFFDVETSWYTIQLNVFQLKNYIKYFDPKTIIKDKKIICICYKWQYEDTIHRLVWNERQDDKKIVKEFIKIIGEADEIVAHNGDRFDMKELRTRAIKNNHLMFPTYRTFDTLKKARKYFNFASNKLDYLGDFLEVGRKLDHEGMRLWQRVIEEKDKDALKTMVDYCEQDVILLEDVFHVLSPFIDHNTNFAVQLGKDKWCCPNCASESVKLSHTDTTAMGWIHRFMKCLKCRKQYKISNKTFMKFLRKNYEGNI